MSAIDKVKNVLHINKDKGEHSTTGTHSTGTTHNTTGTQHAGTAEGVAGPHSSRVGNALDPRVDSDLDHRGATTGSGLTGTHGTTGGYAGTGTGATGTGLTGTHGTHNTHGTTGGYAGTGTGTGTGITGTHGTHNTHGTTGGYAGTGAGLTGTTGNHTGTHTGTGHTGFAGGVSNSTNAGPHDSNMANKLDPRVDSDLDGRGNRHGAATGGIMGASGSHATAGSGTAQNTAGPHNSDMANKIDPRVDSDRDGSKTFGGNKTHAGNHHRDPSDASQVPPSVFAAHQGDPQIMHNDQKHDHARRHSVSYQDKLSGI
ncbi:Uncharacterized protein BP5553_05068 [Venustampulla echinocandica]|uniref:Uncharacterized protein n=1 Tax=Venustampulla echinocandica TaxID=2656787 RepID=A0A370TQ32_9HELO|nr:Uncharacterized protein BP5553_05068 [Venustampulla echinocandica]RDL37635.1 Uncharacterized protein BP5553_05068 [Venustampulla echinocandica]